MGAGKAHGQDRDYQILCRNLLQLVDSPTMLTPYNGDGIDVKVEDLGGTNITFDIALKDVVGNIVVAECRRQVAPVKQEAVFAFAHKVELLRKHANCAVAGVFFTKRQYQIGAVKHATWSGVKVVILDEEQSVQKFVLVYQRYDPQREKRLQEAIAHLTATISFTGSLSMKIIRQDGTVEDLGQVG